MGLPREEVLFEETWISKLVKQRKDIDFIWNFQRSQTTRILKSKDSLEYYSPDFIIIQLGIVDCAPRLINRNGMFYKFLIRFPKNIQNIIWKIIKKIKRRDRRIVDVSKDEFQRNIIDFFSRCKSIGVRKVFYILICSPSDKVIDKSPDFNLNIKEYNNIIEEVTKRFGDLVECINPLDEKAKNEYNDLYVDGYHPSSVGNEVVFKNISKLLK